jgi:hypothetical protein
MAQNLVMHAASAKKSLQIFNITTNRKKRAAELKNILVENQNLVIFSRGKKLKDDRLVVRGK